MALYALAQRTTATAAASAAWEVRSTSTNKPKIMELGISQNAATAGAYGIGRPAAIGVTPTSPQTFIDEGDGNAPAAQTTAAVAWGTGPTVPANFNRRISCAATVGVGAIFTFPRGLGIPISSSIVVWIIATAPVCDLYAVADE
jgi:hypothetical protein